MAFLDALALRLGRRLPLVLQPKPPNAAWPAWR